MRVEPAACGLNPRDSASCLIGVVWLSEFDRGYGNEVRDGPSNFVGYGSRSALAANCCLKRHAPKSSLSSPFAVAAWDMRFNKLPVVDHPDVYVRPIEAADLDAWARYLQDRQVYEHTSWTVTSVAELGTYLWENQSRSADSPLRLALASSETNRLVGTCGFHTVSGQHRSAELAYDLGPTYWGRGIATAAALAFTNWAHDSAGVVRVQATVLQTNTRSIAVLDRTGFVREACCEVTGR